MVLVSSLSESLQLDDGVGMRSCNGSAAHCHAEQPPLNRSASAKAVPLPESLKQLELVFSSLEWHLPEYLEEISIHPVLFMLSTLYSQQASLTFAAQLPVRMVIVWLNEQVVLRR